MKLFSFFLSSKIKLFVLFSIVVLTSACNSRSPEILSVKVLGQELIGEELEVQINSQIEFDIKTVGGAEGISSLEVRDRSGSSVYIIYYKDFEGATEANSSFQLRIVDFDLLSQAYIDSVSNTVSEPHTVSGMFGIPGLSIGQTRQLDVFVRDISNRSHTESLLLKVVE